MTTAPAHNNNTKNNFNPEEQAVHRMGTSTMPPQQNHQQHQQQYRTPVPSDWEHAKILLGRNFRKDYQKPTLYFAKFFLMPVLLMLYCIGFLFSVGGLSTEPSNIVGDLELFEGQMWNYPKTIRLTASRTLQDAGGEVSFQTTVAASLRKYFQSVENTMDVTVVDWNADNVTAANGTNNDRAEFLLDCQETIASSASEEVCVYLDALNNYTIFYGGKEEASPAQSALAAAQWAVNTALLETLGVIVVDDAENGDFQDSYSFYVSQIQRSPQQVRESDYEPVTIVLLLPPVMHVLACAVAAQFLVGPMTYEKINHVTESFLHVGVKMQTYLFQWIGYYAIHLTFTAVILTVVSEYWNLMPMSSPSLIGISHYLGLIHMISQFTLIIQFVEQEELAQSLPFLVGIVCLGMGAGLLFAGMVQSILMYILSVMFPFVGMMQYYGIYITYDYAGYNTGIQWGENVVSSGLMGSVTAQIFGIALYWILCYLYASDRFKDWISSYHPSDNGDATTTPGGSEENTLSGENFERLPPGANVVIRVRGVDHTYRPGRWDCDKSKKETEVLMGLDMDICRGEVFGYLGHNGAGKTTSVKILADQIKLQKGNVTYHFRDGDLSLSSSQDIHTIRNRIGVCPQHNTSLQDDLTARETLRLFAHLKGGIAKESEDQSVAQAVEAEIERRLNDVKFTSVGDSDKPVGTYSGGMKRKVLIAMSLLGDPEVVFLDEPTAGLDPYNRRSIWDMIVEAKQGRSIILTTHFLDEADVLSDRLGIIKDGALITCGSSLFLKHAFGVGYTLKFDAPSSIDLKSVIPEAEKLGDDDGSTHQWRLGHGSESKFSEALTLLKSRGAKNIQLDLTTLEQVFLETGREDDGEDMEESESGNEEVEASHQLMARDDEWLARIWEPRCEIKPVGWWTKLFLVQNFMMQNAWKIKGAILLNISFPLVYLIAGIVLSATVEPELEGEIIENDSIGISTGMAGVGRFFGVPDLNETNPIAPLIPAQAPLVIEDYHQSEELRFVGGYYDQNATLQYANEVTPFAVHIAANIISNYTALLAPNSTIDGIATAVQQLPYMVESPFRSDILFIPFCISFGFAGLAFSVLDILLLKGDNIVSLFRVAGITEWTTYMGVMAYKCATTFFPFFFLLLVLGFSVGLVLFGNAGRWLGSILLMLAYAYSSTPMGLILAKRFIHSDYKSVSHWFPGVYFTFAGVPYIVYSSLLLALPEAKETILIVGDVLCLIPQLAFQRGLGALLLVSSEYRDPDLTWGDVWGFKERVWFTILIMCVVGTLEWSYLYLLTTTREAKTVLSKEDDDAEPTVPLDVSDDPAVAEERERSFASSQGINARDLVKVFKVKDDSKKSSYVKRSVKGLSFGIRQNEILALLGPNGAGKTVCMSSLVGQLTPEHGEVALNNVTVDSTAPSVNPLFASCQVSYVPQFDALFPKQSVQEHLKFYAQIRGLDWKATSTQDHVDAIVKLLGLEKHREKKSEELSGGYKRRLSLAVAMIGYPKAMMLDEVTTGLDPGARRLIWDVLKPRTRHSWDIPAVLLSTHYMEESEALGDRIAIMIDGKLAATGSLQQLYDRYCTSFFVEISLYNSVNGDSAPGKIVGTFDAYGFPANIYESLPYHLKLQVPFRGEDTTQQLADLFQLLESQKRSLGIQFYSVAKMNLEQIFIDLSRQQLEVNAEFQSERP